VILVQKSAVADFRMVFFNPDGTEADLCGNGARCVAAFAREIGVVTSPAMTFETRAGLVDAEVSPSGAVKVWMPEPKNRRYGLQVKVGDTFVAGDYVEAGVPHFIVPCESVASVDVEGLGRALRLSDAFAPNGTNVDFVQLLPAHKAIIRTYERGVEAESGACGTGAVATAVVAVETKKMSLPVHIRTSQGYTLTVDGDWRHAKATGFTLTGPVKKVFDGVVDLDSFDTGNEME
jgi:diaminopimelate epimerase